ncbi:MAG TPA: Gfo/Idh/MocA family oxidoreductase [Chthonomonadales bacterium]|nr:Gfo/Idh/MocA family oxidoreductase [Chthonomonadales bacterium]
MPEPLGIGVVGAGSIGIRGALEHLCLPDVQHRVRLAAVCDPAPGRAAAAAAKYGVAHWYLTLDELLADPNVDAVTLGSPIGLHYEQGLAAIRAGKHVHFNKTMTTAAADATHLIEEAAARHVRLVASPGQMLRPLQRRIRRLIQEGAIGALAWAATGSAFGAYHESERVRQGDDALTNIDPSWYWRKPGGGPMYDMTVYGLHSLTGVLGPAKRVTGMSGVRVRERLFRGQTTICDADDNTFLVADFGDSVYAYVYGAAAGMLTGFGGGTYLGTGGSIAGDRLNGEPIDYPGRDLVERLGRGDNVLLPHVKGRHAEMEEAHVFEDILQLVDWVRDGTPSICTAEHARHVIEILEAGYRAAETGVTQALTTSFVPAPGE